MKTSKLLKKRCENWSQISIKCIDQTLFVSSVKLSLSQWLQSGLLTVKNYQDSKYPLISVHMYGFTLEGECVKES